MQTFMLRPSRCTTQTASAPQPSTLRPFGSLRGFVNAETRIHADHSQVRDMLQKIAEAQGHPSINRLLEAWIRVHPTMIRREIRHSETGFKTGLFFKSNSKRWRARWDSYQNGFKSLNDSFEIVKYDFIFLFL